MTIADDIRRQNNRRSVDDKMEVDPFTAQVADTALDRPDWTDPLLHGGDVMRVAHAALASIDFAMFNGKPDNPTLRDTYVLDGRESDMLGTLGFEVTKYKASYLIMSDATKVILVFAPTRDIDENRDLNGSHAPNINSAANASMPGFKGLWVHRGWADCVKKIMDGDLKEELAVHGIATKELHIGGFSLGGALATYTLYRLLVDDVVCKTKKLNLVTIGAPWSSTPTFLEAFYAQVKDRGLTKHFKATSLEIEDDGTVVAWLAAVTGGGAGAAAVAGAIAGAGGGAAMGFIPGAIIGAIVGAIAGAGVGNKAIAPGRLGDWMWARAVHSKYYRPDLDWSEEDASQHSRKHYYDIAYARRYTDPMIANGGREGIVNEWVSVAQLPRCQIKETATHTRQGHVIQLRSADAKLPKGKLEVKIAKNGWTTAWKGLAAGTTMLGAAQRVEGHALEKFCRVTLDKEDVFGPSAPLTYDRKWAQTLILILAKASPGYEPSYGVIDAGCLEPGKTHVFKWYHD